MRDSAVWYFRRIAELGAERELAYLKAFDYGNQDASGPLTSFWLGDSLKISPESRRRVAAPTAAGPLRGSLGRVVRGERAWTFVSCVIGDEKALAAVELAAERLVRLRVLGAGPS